jgi:cellulose synthase (UDP-forming)
VLRRSALEAIGGVATETITEDILTTIKLHAADWRTAYHNEILATGIAPDDLDAFLTQRKRWAQGAMQILRSRYNPLWTKGLTVRQRLSYWGSMSTYFASFQKLVLLLTPLVVLATGILPMRAFGWDFAAHFVPYFVLGLAANSLCGRGYGRYFDTERFNLLKAFAFVRASVALVVPRSLRFEVTRKSQQVRPAREIIAALPHLTLLVSSVCAMGWAGYEVITHGIGGSQQLALELTAIWAVYNAGIIGLAVRAVLSRSHRRARYRFARRVPLIIEELYPPARYQVSSTDMTPDGLSFTHAVALARGTQVVVDLALPGDARLQSSALVMNSVPLASGGPFRVGVQFTELSDAERDALTLYLFTGETDRTHGQSDEELAAA